MTFRLPRLPEADEIVTDKRRPTFKFQRWWQSVVVKLETQESGQDDLLAQILAAQDDATQALADAAAAQATADAALAAVPPTTTITVSTNTVLDGTAASVLVDASGGVVTITLPSALSGPTLQTITKIDASGNAVNVVPTGTDTLNGGGGPVALTVQNEVHNFTTDQVDQWFG